MSVKSSIVLFCLFFIAIHSNTAQSVLHPMVDGKNTEYAALEVAPIAIGEGVNLYIFQNQSYVWISYDYPAGSYGTLDMQITTEQLAHPINIHVSAQLGEWPVGEEAQKPQSANSDLWWNMDGWIANSLWANGIDTAGFRGPQMRLKNGEMRELQLDKNRFGKGEWNFRLTINAIRNEAGQFVTVNFPTDKTYYSLLVD